MATVMNSLPRAGMLQNFSLVWLDKNINENNDYWRNSIITLQQIVNTVNLFNDVDECIDFITEITEEGTFMIISETLSQSVLPVIQDISQVKYVYIFSDNDALFEKLTKQFSKVKGISTNIKFFHTAIEEASKKYDHSAISISFLKSIDVASDRNPDTLDCSFMYTQILKEILLSIDFNQEHINQFLDYCRVQFVGNITNLNYVDKIEKEYNAHQPIWWYTCGSFLYSMLNRALRLMDINLIVKMGFFVCDLHKNIVALHSEQYSEHNSSRSFTVYRGQGLTKTDFEQLLNTEGRLMAFNNFLSTSHDRAVSKTFAESNVNDPDLIGVLFHITVDLSSMSLFQFANINHTSYYPGENESLFSMHSIFRIGQIKQLDESKRLWQVDLILTSDNDPQLKTLTESIQEETFSFYTPWHRLGLLMLKIGQYNDAEKLFQILLERTTNDVEKAQLFHYLGLIKDYQGKYAEGVEFFEKSIQIYKKTASISYNNLSCAYISLCATYQKMGEYSKVLKYYENVLEIQQQHLPENNANLSTSYNNIGVTYSRLGEYTKALHYCKKASEVEEKNAVANHPRLAVFYNCIGTAYAEMHEHSKALKYYEKALEIRKKSLPVNHPDLALSYNNIGSVYHDIGKVSEALEYYEKAHEIHVKAFFINHPDTAGSYNNIGILYYKMGRFSKALEYLEKALEIQQKSLPANHRDLGTSLNNIGLLYGDMSKHSKAIEYLERALKIWQRVLPDNHLDLATLYNNIGELYRKIGKYSEAISYTEKALNIFLITLPTNHPNCADHYTKIGLMYKNVGQYLKALEYDKKGLLIYQKILPANHSTLALSYNNIGVVYRNLGEYSKALEYYEKALEIHRKILPANHPTLAMVYANITALYEYMD